MLDMDLAELYGVENKQLKRAVRRNINRFPNDFMFELTSGELAKWRSQFGTSNREKMGIRIKPFVFTEHGVLMLASVLNSERAVQVNIQIVRIFAKMRQMMDTHNDMMRKLDELQKNDLEQERQINLIFEYLKQLEQANLDEQNFKERKRIGFRRNEEK